MWDFKFDTFVGLVPISVKKVLQEMQIVYTT
jgi:hypothetical protein